MPEKLNLLSRSINAAKWNYIGNGVKVLLQFLIGVWLARLLGPEAFGVVAVAWLMIGVGKLVSDFGFSAALIQRKNLTDQDVGYVFTIQVMIGLILSLICFLCSNPIASFFNHPPAEPIIAVMAWLFLIQAIGQTTTASLNRALRFKFSQVVSLITYLVGYVGIGLPMAHLGYGAWSLVAAQMAQSISYTLVVLLKSGISIRPSIRPSKSGLFSFGGKVIGANLCSYAILNMDSFVVGKFLGVTQLGIYSRAMTLLGTPNSVIVTGLQSVLFSATSREQHKPESIRRNFLAATEFIGLISLPIFLTIAVIPDIVILGIYGESWQKAISPLVPLALAMPVHAFLAIIGPVLMAINRTDLEVYAQLIALIISAPLLVFAGMQSLDMLAWAVFATYFIRWIALLLAAYVGLGISIFVIVKALQSGLVLATLVACTVALISHFFVPPIFEGKLPLLIIIALTTALIYTYALGPFISRGILLQLLLERNVLPTYVRNLLRLK